MKNMKKELIQLLTIQAPSGQEHKVVKYAKPVLEKLCDKVWLDGYQNLLAEKIVGTGKGATIILSAHMDSVRNIQKGRKVVEKDGVFTSTKGVLGADDRAGMAIILSVLRNIEKTGFDGIIKVAFSREEEIGCVGSGHIDKEWIKGADLAIVVDRRGNNDIVVGNFSQAFCSTAVGDFLENCSAILDSDWSAVEGGVSDACTFAEMNVNSVNLSAGYRHEHTEKEYVVFDDMKKTVNLMLQALALVNDFAGTFGDVPTENKWIIAYNYTPYAYNKYSDSSESWYDEYDEFDNRDLYEVKEVYGTVKAEIVGGNVCINQKCGDSTDEIYITKKTFEMIATAYYADKNKDASDDLLFTEDDLANATVDKYGNISVRT